MVQCYTHVEDVRIRERSAEICWLTAYIRDQEENWSDIAIFTPYRSGNKSRYCWIHSNRWQVVEL